MKGINRDLSEPKANWGWGSHITNWLGTKIIGSPEEIARRSGLHIQYDIYALVRDYFLTKIDPAGILLRLQTMLMRWKVLKEIAFWGMIFNLVIGAGLCGWVIPKSVPYAQKWLYSATNWPGDTMRRVKGIYKSATAPSYANETERLKAEWKQLNEEFTPIERQLAALNLKQKNALSSIEMSTLNALEQAANLGELTPQQKEKMAELRNKSLSESDRMIMKELEDKAEKLNVQSKMFNLLVQAQYYIDKHKAGTLTEAERANYKDLKTQIEVLKSNNNKGDKND